MKTRLLKLLSAVTVMLSLVSLAQSADSGQTVCPFNGKDLAGWKVREQAQNVNKWLVGTAQVNPANPHALIGVPGGSDLVNVPAVDDKGKVLQRSLDLYSEAKFGDARIEVEVMVPKGSNSGIYVMGEYEIQVLDSFGKEKEKLGMGDMGAVYGAAVPKLNASQAPGEWQKYEIEYRAPRFDAQGKKTETARLVKVILNGQVLHENLELPKNTPGGVTGKEAPTGPIMFQGNHGPVAYRNLKITPLDR